MNIKDLPKEIEKSKMEEKQLTVQLRNARAYKNALEDVQALFQNVGSIESFQVFRRLKASKILKYKCAGEIPSNPEIAESIINDIAEQLLKGRDKNDD